MSLGCNQIKGLRDLRTGDPRNGQEILPDAVAVAVAGAGAKYYSPGHEKNFPTEVRGGLRGYQKTSIDELRNLIASGVKRIVLALPTGAGKSAIAADIIRSATGKGKRVLFVVNRIGLVSQFSERLTAHNIAHGILRGDETRNPTAQVVVGSIQTIARRGVEAVDVIVIDEAHAVPGTKHYRDLLVANRGAVVLGLTATPWSNGMGEHEERLGGPLFERLVVGASIGELIAGGFLVDCAVFAPATPDFKGVKLRRNAFGELDLSDADAARVMDQPKLTGGIVEHWQRLANGTQTVVFASSIAHSMHIVGEFKAAGISAEHLSAYTPTEERAEILARHASGETKVVSCVALLREGWDSPSTETMILARPTRSLIAFVQMAGRVLRPAPGKTKALLIDHTGSVLHLGLPTDDRPMKLHVGKPAHVSARKEPPRLKPCAKCGYVDHYRRLLGTRICPNCGFEAKRQPKEIVAAEGELQRVDRTKLPRKQDFYSELLFVARERGRSPGWVGHTYRKRFGTWPRNLVDVPRRPSATTLGFVRHLDIAFSKGSANAHA